MTLKYDVSKSVRDDINTILDRYQEERESAHLLALDETERLHHYMNLCAVHATEGLNLMKLATGSTMDLFHDLAGIDLYLDRDTGKLGHFFIPRCNR